MAKAESFVLSPKFSAGPHGLGDPDDKSLRKVETEVLVPKLMREIAKAEKCISEVKAFEECCKSSSLLMVVKCQSENTVMKDCMVKWYNNEDFKKYCTEKYLEQRSEFRRTGVKQSVRRA